MTRVAIFVDGQNFHRQWIDQADGYPFDWSWLMQWVMKRVGGDELFGVHYYSGDLPDSGVHRFIDKLEKTEGFFVRRFPLKTMTTHCPLCDKNYEYAREKEVDTTIVADIVRMAAMDVFDVAVLMSGDGDLAPALETAQLFGKKTWAATWSNGLSFRIKQAAFGYVDLMDAIDIVQEERQKERQKELDAIEAKKKEQAEVAEALKRAQEAQVKAQEAAQKEPESEPEQVSQVISKPEPVSKKPLNFTLNELYFMDGLSIASSRLPFVGVGYFLSRWDLGCDILETREERQEILDSLLDKEVLVLEESSEGGKILKFRNKPDNIDQLIDRIRAKRAPMGTFADAMRDVLPFKKG